MNCNVPTRRPEFDGSGKSALRPNIGHSERHGVYPKAAIRSGPGRVFKTVTFLASSLVKSVGCVGLVIDDSVDPS